MAVDRGGLDYTIEVRDAFTGNLERFRSDVDKSRESWGKFKSELAGGAKAAADIQTTTGQASKGLGRLGLQAEKSARAQRRLSKEFNVSADAVKKLESRRRRAASTIRQEQIQDKARVATAKNLTDGLNKLDRAEISAAKAAKIRRARINAIVNAEEIQARQRLKELRQLKALQREQAKLTREREAALKQTERLRKAAERETLRTDPAAAARADIAREDFNTKKTRFKEEIRLQRELDQAVRAGTFQRTGKGRTADLEAFALQTKKAAEATKQLERDQKKLGVTTQANQGVFQQFFFSFRRLFGILAVFTLARKGIQLITGAIKEAVGFNARLETSILGIQSILAATGTLANVQGELVEGAEKFALANAESRRQVALLRRDGLRTAATFTQLLETFQVALAPGLRAGLTINQVRGFAVRIAQAAAAIGLPQNQLAEEIRSVLQGTIQSRTTRIAVALGISNEDIKRAREAGELADFLLERFSAFQFAGEAALTNFGTIISNLKDATSQLLGAGGQGFFTLLKENLNGILDTIATATSGGVIINPTAIKLAKAFFSILENIMDAARDVGESLTLEGSAEAAETVANAINAVVNVLGEFAKGFVDSFTTVLSIVGGIRNAAQRLGESLGIAGDVVPLFENLVKFLGQTVGFFITLRLIVFALRGPLFLLGVGAKLFKNSIALAVTPLRLIASLLSAASLKALALAAPFVAILAVVGLIVAAFNNDLIRSIKLGESTIGNFADKIKIDLGLQITKVAAVFEFAWIKASSAVQRAWNRVFEFFKDVGLGIVETLLEGAEFVGIDVEKALERIRKQRDDLSKDTDKQNKKLTDAADARIADIKEEIVFQRRLAKARAIAADRDAAAGPQRTLAEAFNEAIDQGQAFLSSIMSKVTGGLDNSVDSVDELIAKLKDLPSLIGQTNTTLEQQGKLLDTITKKADKASRSLSFALDAEGVTGGARRQAQLLADIPFQLEKTAREFNSQIRQAQGNLDGLAVRSQKIQENIERSGVLQREDAAFLADAAGDLAQAEQRREIVLTTIKGLTRELAGVEKLRDKEAIASTKRRLEEFQKESDSLKTRAEVSERLIRERIASLQLEAGQEQEVFEIVRKLVEIDGQRVLQSTLLTIAITERGRIEDLINRRAIDQIGTLIIKERERLREARERLSVELEADRIRAGAVSRTTGVAGQDLPGSQNERAREIGELQAQHLELVLQTATLQRKIELERASLLLQAGQTAAKEEETKSQIEQLRIQLAATADEAKRSTILSQISGKQQALESLQRARSLQQEQLAGLTETERLELEKARTAASNLNKELQILIAVQQSPGQFGFLAGLQDFAEEAADKFKLFAEIATTTINGLSDFISGSLADALDPTKKVDIVGRFKTLVDSIVKVILDGFVRLLILKPLLDALGLGGGGVGGIVSGFGFNRGGLVDPFGKARGLAAGGSPKKPENLHPSDKVPIWAAAGEWYMRVAAVRKYGTAFMAAINEGRINPSLAKALVGVKKNDAERVRVAGAHSGFASGGLVGAVSGSSGQGSDGELTIVNVFEREQFFQEIASRDGQKVLVNVMRANNDNLRGAV